MKESKSNILNFNNNEFQNLIKEYTNKNKAIQESLEHLLDNENNEIDYFTNLTQVLLENTLGCKIKIQEFLNLLSQISKHYHRTPNFFNTIEKVLLFMKDCIQRNFTSDELFHIFKSNKRVLLFLIQQKMIVIDEIITHIMINKYESYNYEYYFYPEIKYYLTLKSHLTIGESLKNIHNFNEKRKIGENDSYMCQIIRNDLIEDFKTYADKENITPHTKIEPSIFETNPILYKKQPTVIEYATFFGSIKIFKFLIEKCQNLDKSLLTYAVHSGNEEMIKIIETKIENENDGNDDILIESIKCHQKKLFNYFLKGENKEYEKYNYYCIKYYDFENICGLFREVFFYFLCKYDHIEIVDLFVRKSDIDIDFTIDDKSPICISYIKGNFNLTDLLIECRGIGTSAFENCHSMTSYSIPSTVKEIGISAFCDCVNLKEITIPDSVEVIGVNSFYNCVNLEQIRIPSSVKIIGECAFGQCISLKEVILSPNLKEIQSNAFTDCKSLESISIPDSVECIGEGAFSGCFKLTKIKLPKNLKLIADALFFDCNSLKNVEIPQSVKSIGKASFNQCLSIESITIPSSVEVIKDSAFSSCTSLKQVIVPSSVIQIESSAFIECDSLEKVDLFESKIKEIESCTFWGCKKLKEVLLPPTLTKIGEIAFAMCISIEKIDLPISLIELGDGAFTGCSGLKQITIPHFVTKIPQYAFADCYNLKDADIPDSVNEIGQDAFLSCKLSASLLIPSVTMAGEGEFEKI